MGDLLPDLILLANASGGFTRSNEVEVRDGIDVFLFLQEIIFFGDHAAVEEFFSFAKFFESDVDIDHVRTREGREVLGVEKRFDDVSGIFCVDESFDDNVFVGFDGENVAGGFGTEDFINAEFIDLTTSLVFDVVIIDAEAATVDDGFADDTDDREEQGKSGADQFIDPSEITKDVLVDLVNDYERNRGRCTKRGEQVKDSGTIKSKNPSNK